MTTTSASNDMKGGKTYPPPDLSKTYTEVPRRQAPKKGFISRSISIIRAELGIDVLEPTEKAISVCLIILAVALLIGIPLYVFQYLYAIFYA